jgi:hypothetical protein
VAKRVEGEDAEVILGAEDAQCESGELHALRPRQEVVEAERVEGRQPRVEVDRVVDGRRAGKSGPSRPQLAGPDHHVEVGVLTEPDLWVVARDRPALDDQRLQARRIQPLQDISGLDRVDVGLERVEPVRLTEARAGRGLGERGATDPPPGERPGPDLWRGGAAASRSPAVKSGGGGAARQAPARRRAIRREGGVGSRGSSTGLPGGKFV